MFLKDFVKTNQIL